MNATFTPYDGPRAGSYTLASSAATPVVVQAGARATLEVLQVHVGLRGLAGANGSTYEHTQSIASTGWTVPHNLNRHPSITTTDHLGNVIYGDVSYVDANIVQITHGSALTGFAYFS